MTIRVTGVNGCFAEITYTINITAPGCPVITIVPPTLPNGTVATAYSQSITASGGTGAYVFTVSTGTLPAGTDAHARRRAVGDADHARLFRCHYTGDRREHVLCRDRATGGDCRGRLPGDYLAPATLPNGTLGVAYSQTITASGGTGPYVFTVSSGTLPEGLTLSAAGVLAGTPTALGSSTVTIWRPARADVPALPPTRS